MEVTRTYLEIGGTELDDGPELATTRLTRCPASFYRYLYGETGRAHRWTDRLDWSDAQVRAHVDDPRTLLDVATVDGAPGGWFELRRGDNDVEIAYFGLLPEFIGRGLGAPLLRRAVRVALAEGTGRVWLHTCTLDHPAALANYRARGFRPWKTETYTVADAPPA